MIIVLSTRARAIFQLIWSDRTPELQRIIYNTSILQYNLHWPKLHIGRIRTFKNFLRSYFFRKFGRDRIPDYELWYCKCYVNSSIKNISLIHIIYINGPNYTRFLLRLLLGPYLFINNFWVSLSGISHQMLFLVICLRQQITRVGILM